MISEPWIWRQSKNWRLNQFRKIVFIERSGQSIGRELRTPDIQRFLVPMALRFFRP